MEVKKVWDGKDEAGPTGCNSGLRVHTKSACRVEGVGGERAFPLHPSTPSNPPSIPEEIKPDSVSEGVEGWNPQASESGWERWQGAPRSARPARHGGAVASGDERERRQRFQTPRATRQANPQRPSHTSIHAYRTRIWHHLSCTGAFDNFRGRDLAGPSKTCQGPSRREIRRRAAFPCQRAAEKGPSSAALCSQRAKRRRRRRPPSPGNPSPRTVPIPTDVVPARHRLRAPRTRGGT